MIRRIARSAVPILVAAAGLAPAAGATVREIASLPGGQELGLAGPVFSGPRVLVAWVGAEGIAHLRVAGRAGDLWSAPTPAPPPPSGPDDRSVRHVTQRITGLASAPGGIAVARYADLSVEPACVNANPPCEIAVMARPYREDLLSGAPGTRLQRRYGYGPSPGGGCPPAAALDVSGLAAGDFGVAAALAPPPCFGSAAGESARLVVWPFGTGRPVTLRTRDTIAGVAAAGRFIARVILTRGGAAELDLLDYRGRRRRGRWSLAAAPSALVVQADGRIAAILPGVSTGGPCPPPSSLVWTGLGRRPQRLAGGIAPGSPVALSAGRALAEIARVDPGGGCPSAGSLAGWPLAGGQPSQMATLDPGEIPTGSIAWDGRRAAFAVIVPASASGGSSLRTSVRVASP